MAMEIPSSLIRQIQDALRKEAGMPACDPPDSALPGLPSFEDAISGLDPAAPPYLRCKVCWGALLRGLRSTVCVYCGAEQRREGPPLSMSFNATLACRNLLQSLDLDGSEVVALNIEPKDSGKSQGMEKDGLLLSSLLDIELNWPFEGAKAQSSSSTNNVPIRSTLNLSGVDLDNFFAGTKKEVGSNTHHVSDGILGPDKETDSEGFGLFEELRPIDRTVDSVETKPTDVDYSSGVWEAEFQSANSHISATDPNSRDLFQDSSSSNYTSATVEEQLNIESGTNREGESTAFSSETSQIPSMNDSWPSDALWHTNSVVPSAAEKFSGRSNANDGELKSNSMADDWAQSDIWPIGSTNVLSTSENIQSNDDSFDDWQDFTSSRNAPDASSNSWTQASTVITSSNDYEVGISSVSFIDRVEDMDFGGFVQSYVLPGSDLRRESSKLDIVQSEASASGRTNELEKTEVKADVWPMADKNEIPSPTQLPGNAHPDVQALMSQMHDVSFMLENNISVPKKAEPSD